MADIMPAAGLPASEDAALRRLRADYAARRESRIWWGLAGTFCGLVAFLLAALGCI
jgi:hypothetical protein